MKLSSISARGLLVLALTLVAACGDSTGIDTSVGGEYTLVGGVVSSLDDGQTTRKTVPVVLYEGPASAGSTTYDIRWELLSATMTLVEGGSTYQFAGTYRLTEKLNRFPAETLTAEASGSYRLDGSTLTLNPSASSDVEIGSDAVLYNGKLSIEVLDPIFGIESLYEFRK